MQNKQHTVINLPTLSVGASCHKEQISRNTSLKVPYFHHIVAQNYTIYTLFIFNPVYIYTKKLQKITQNWSQNSRFCRSKAHPPPNFHTLHTIFSIHYLYKLYKSTHQKQSRKSGENAFLILSILINFSAPQTRNPMSKRAKIRYNRNLKHIKNIKYQPQNRSASHIKYRRTCGSNKCVHVTGTPHGEDGG